ncbi:RDD family protein [uncultured Algibacter sp.]|uniref:RDD family protein n=1 Tax=uncultured Algibacter sp. TaxID=298659 RepID=UPI00262F89F7|nr:RDD family protein [uncultured Algibacter sp.]
MPNSFNVTPDLYATKGNRFTNYIVDIIFIVVIFLVFVFVSSYFYYSYAEDTTAVDAYLNEEETISPLLDRLITSVALALIYFALEFFTRGRSIGKFITKTRVVLADGSKPTALDYLKRSFSRIIPFEAFSFLGAEGRGWHDTISKTYVVDITRFEAKIRAQNELDQIGIVQEDI